MPKATIRLGSQGDDVKRVQRYFVRARILDPTHLDGDFGPETDGLVRGFQQDNGLVVDGIVGPQTRAALGSYLEASPTLAEGDVGPDVARLQLALSRTYDAGDPGRARLRLRPAGDFQPERVRGARGDLRARLATPGRGRGASGARCDRRRRGRSTQPGLTSLTR